MSQQKRRLNAKLRQKEERDIFIAPWWIKLLIVLALAAMIQHI